MDMMKASTTANLDFAQALVGVKSPSEAMELWTSHARKQFEAFTAHTKELAELDPEGCDRNRRADQGQRVETVSSRPPDRFKAFAFERSPGRKPGLFVLAGRVGCQAQKPRSSLRQQGPMRRAGAMLGSGCGKLSF